MNRRNFLSTLIGGVATAAAVRTFPFRVYSFPKEIVTGKPIELWVGDSVWIVIDEPAHKRRPVAVAIYRSALVFEPPTITEILSLEEAKATYGYEYMGPSNHDLIF